jgi:hypothetical protein
MPLLNFYSLVCFLFLTITVNSVAANEVVESATVNESGLDQVSTECLSCHNASNKDLAGLCQLEHDSFCSNHNFNSSYTEMATLNKELRPKSNLPSEMILYKDKITCFTCHGAAPHEGQPTTIVNNRSALCLACHLR